MSIAAGDACALGVSMAAVKHSDGEEADISARDIAPLEGGMVRSCFIKSLWFHDKHSTQFSGSKHATK